MHSKIAIVALAAVVVVGAWSFYRLSALASRGGVDAPLYSTERYDPYGTAALKELLDERGAMVSTLERPGIDPESDAGALIQALPLDEVESFLWIGQSDYYETQTRRMRDWISDGNTVIQLSRNCTRLLRSFIDDNAEKTCDDIPVLAKDIQAYETAGKFPDGLPGNLAHIAFGQIDDENKGGELILREPFGIGGDLEINGLRLVSRWRGKAVMIDIAHGEGRYIFIGAPTPALNMGVDMGNNLDFMLDAVDGKPVIFDEWIHGIGHSGTIVGLIRDTGLAPVILQIAFVLGLYVWSTMGHRRVDREELVRRRTSAEQIETLGRLYRRSLDPGEMVRMVRAEVMERVAAGLRRHPSEVPSIITGLPRHVAGKIDSIMSVIRRAETSVESSIPLTRIDSDLAEALTMAYDFEREMNRERKHTRKP